MAITMDYQYVVNRNGFQYVVNCNKKRKTMNNSNSLPVSILATGNKWYSFKSWKKFPIERKIGTHIVNVSDSIKSCIAESPVLNAIVNM